MQKCAQEATGLMLKKL